MDLGWFWHNPRLLGRRSWPWLPHGLPSSLFVPPRRLNGLLAEKVDYQVLREQPATNYIVVR